MTRTQSWPGVHALATTTDARKAIAGLIVKNAAGVPRAGVFPRHANALVTSRGDLNVNLGIFEAAAVQFGGAILFTNDAVAQLPSPLVSPGAGITNYYVVYAKQNETSSPGTDANNNAIFGTVLSTSSFTTARASGTRMDGSGTGLPTGAVELGTVQMPTGVSATNAGGVTITPTHLFTAAAGGVVWARNPTELTAWTPADGALAFRMDTGAHYRRDGGGWAPLAGGLVPLIPSAVSGATVTAAGNKVSFTAADTTNGVRVDGVFTSEFDKYLIVFDSKVSSAGSLVMRVRAGGTDAAGSNYDYEFLQGAGAVVTAGVSTAASVPLTGTGTHAVGEVQVFRPAIADVTPYLIDSVSTGATYTRFNSGGRHNLSTAYDGFVIYPSAGTLSGSLQVYGYGGA